MTHASRTVYPIAATKSGLALQAGPTPGEWKKLVEQAPMSFNRFAVALVKFRDDTEAWPVWSWSWKDGLLALATVPGSPGDRFPTSPRLDPRLRDVGTAFALLDRTTGQVRASNGSWHASREAWAESLAAVKP